MLTSRGPGLEVELVSHDADEQTGIAHWIARYPFANTGRQVVNDIHAEFRFRDGLIAEHDDRFDLRRWAAQAFGAPGKLGYTPLLPFVVHRFARRELGKYPS